MNAMRLIVIVLFLTAIILLTASDFTVHYPAYYSIPIGFSLGGLAGLALPVRRR